MSKKKKNDPVEAMDELTEAMHATFWVTDEEDRKHRVWAAIRHMNTGVGWPETLDETLSMQQVTMADYEKYKDTWPI